MDVNGKGALKFLDITRGLDECICNEVSMFRDKVFAAVIRQPAVENVADVCFGRGHCHPALHVCISPYVVIVQMMVMLASDRSQH